jgi:hypothetical protein
VLLITLLDDNEAKPPIIVAYLRKRNVVLSHCYSSANVIEPREPHTRNNILIAVRALKTRESCTRNKCNTIGSG